MSDLEIEQSKHFFLTTGLSSINMRLCAQKKKEEKEPFIKKKSLDHLFLPVILMVLSWIKMALRN